MKEINLEVKGMACEGCEKRIQNALQSMEGVEKVIANHQKGIVCVIAKESVNEDKVKDKIDDIGFEVVR